MNNNDIMRFFISSTFVGLEKERGYLMTKVFPLLRYEALKRNITLFPIDLRWGITKEQAERGEIIWICLNEIIKSKPFFIGILGERYGWQPELDILKKDTQLSKRFPDIVSDLQNELSMSEIEIRHAVLRNKECRMDAFFYITDSQNIEEPQQKLIKSIYNDGRYIPKYYHTKEELGQLIYNDIINILNNSFNIEKDLENQIQINNQRAELFRLTSIYVDRNKYSSDIESFIRDNNKKSLLIYGDRGCGKSSILADIITRIQEKCVYLLVGGTLCDKSCEHIQRYLIYSLNYQLHDSSSDYEKEVDLFSTLTSVFDKISLQRQRYIIIIDGLNEIVETTDASHSILSWLPETPHNVKLIVSTNSYQQKEVLEQRGFSTLFIPYLSQVERERIIERYLNNYSKNLSLAQIKDLASDQKSKDSVLLTYMLNEMVSDSVFETIDTYISQYKEANGRDEFLAGLISRACHKFKESNAKSILGLMAISKEGLKPDEIMAMIHLSIFEWSQFYCAYSFLFIEHNGLISIADNEVLHFVETVILKGSFDIELNYLFRTYFEKVLASKMPNDNHVVSKEEAMAFIKCKLNGFGPVSEEEIKLYINTYLRSDYLFEGKERSFVELAYVYWRKEEYRKLRDLLFYPVCFVYMHQSNSFNLRKYCLDIIKNDDSFCFDKVSIKNEESFTDSFLAHYYYSLSKLIQSDYRIGNTQRALWAMEKSICHIETSDTLNPAERIELIPRYNELGRLYSDIYDINSAIECYKKAIQYADGGDSYSMINSIRTSISLIQEIANNGSLDEAINLCDEFVEKINSLDVSSHDRKKLLYDLYFIRSNVYAAKAETTDSEYDKYILLSIKELEEYLKINKELLKIDQQQYISDYVESIANLAIGYFEVEEFEKSIEKFQEAESLIKSISKQNAKAVSLLAQIQSNYGAVLTDIAFGTNGSFDNALTELTESRDLYEELYASDKQKYSIPYGEALFNLGRVYLRIGQPLKAALILKDSLDKLGKDLRRKANCLAAIGLAYMNSGNMREKSRYLSLAKSIYLDLYNQTRLSYYSRKIVQIDSLLNQ